MLRCMRRGFTVGCEHGKWLWRESMHGGEVSSIWIEPTAVKAETPRLDVPLRHVSRTLEDGDTVADIWRGAFRKLDVR